MKILIYLISLFYSGDEPNTQILKLHYLGYKMELTKNCSYLSQKLIFLNNVDTVNMNVRMPIDTATHHLYDYGIFYNCYLKKDSVYTITLKKICVSDIPSVYSSYYKTNTTSDKNDCSKFKEVEYNTPYIYRGNYGKYIDIDGVLYEIVGLSPSDGCFFQN